jgi:hypothetical protein
MVVPPHQAEPSAPTLRSKLWRHPRPRRPAGPRITEATAHRTRSGSRKPMRPCPPCQPLGTDVPRAYPASRSCPRPRLPRHMTGSITITTAEDLPAGLHRGKSLSGSAAMTRTAATCIRLTPATTLRPAQPPRPSHPGPAASTSFVLRAGAPPGGCPLPRPGTCVDLHLPGVNRPDRGRGQIRGGSRRWSWIGLTFEPEPSCWIRPWPFSRCSRYGGCPRRSRRRARQPDQGGSPGWKVCGKAAYPAEMPVLPKPAAPPVPGSPAVAVAGVPAGTMTGAVTTYLDNATPAP